MLVADAVAEWRNFPIARDAVAEMDRWIEGIGQRWDIHERVLFRARVCVSELATNVVEHGHGQSPTDSIRLELRHKPPALEIEISDPSAAFDPVTAPPVEDDEDRIGGRGLRLVRAYAHSLSYRRVRDRNVVILQLVPKSD
jgi:anti-sigma regulatory factor (Ser/Thr protein kinase)